MKVRLIEIEKFRGVELGRVEFKDNALLVGGNNVGKSTVCEALDLVLGPERLYRRPVVDEHDFFGGRYLKEDGSPISIEIRVVLVDVKSEALLRFAEHVRRWDDTSLTYVDEAPGGADRSDGEEVVWALPLIFVARYDREEDDFVGDTFFDHPTLSEDDISEEEADSLGAGRSRFTTTQKRLCGFIYLRALRTGSRALSLQRGSLLDTILRLNEEGVAEMWMDTLKRLREIDPAIGDVEHLKTIRKGIRERMGRFVNLAPGDDSATFFASDLTREHLREVVRLFIATEPSNLPVPFSRQGMGSINLLVFALLTLIADLKRDQSVIFAMEEPEIALPPHVQRRVTRFVLREMGQTIVTSHSPYVIEQFASDDVVMLKRDAAGKLESSWIDSTVVKPKTYRTERRQFAEAILSRGVLVVEGSTEVSLFSIASSILERHNPDYTHIDFVGLSIFNAGGDGAVPAYGPIFKSFDKFAFGVFDKQESAFSDEVQESLSRYDRYWESPEKGIEKLLVTQMPVPVLRRFLETVALRDDYPNRRESFDRAFDDDHVIDLALDVLKARKGEAWGYASMLIGECESESELPEFVRSLLFEIDSVMGVQEIAPDNEEELVEGEISRPE